MKTGTTIERDEERVAAGDDGTREKNEEEWDAGVRTLCLL